VKVEGIHTFDDERQSLESTLGGAWVAEDGEVYCQLTTCLNFSNHSDFDFYFASSTLFPYSNLQKM
jgi:hypothetical protein